MTTSFALQKTIFATMKKKLADAENRVRELEEENMALHFFANIGYDNVFLDDLEYDNEPATCTDDESSEVANTVDTLVDTIEMTHADVAVEHPDKSAHYKHWEAWSLQNKIANGMTKLRILFRFAKKVVLYRRQRIQQELAVWRERINVVNEQVLAVVQKRMCSGMIIIRFINKVAQIRRQRIAIKKQIADVVRNAVKHAQKCAQQAQNAVDARKEIIRKEQELALCLAFDYVFDISHRAQLHAHKFAQQAEDAVNLMLENLD